MRLFFILRNYYLGLYYWTAENSVAKTRKSGEPDKNNAIYFVGWFIMMVHTMINLFSLGAINDGQIVRYLFKGLSEIHVFSTYKGDFTGFTFLLLLFIPLIGYLLLRFRMPYEAIRPRLESTPYFLDISKRRFIELVCYPILGLLVICVAMHIVF
jgi:hypothetical protein